MHTNEPHNTPKSTALVRNYYAKHGAKKLEEIYFEHVCANKFKSQKIAPSRSRGAKQALRRLIVVAKAVIVIVSAIYTAISREKAKIASGNAANIAKFANRAKRFR